MSKNIQQIYTANPITSNASTDLMYFGQSPYTTGDDAAMTYGNFSAQFGAPYTAAALTEVSDTNVTLTLGGSPTNALLHATSITAGWTGTLAASRGGTGINSLGTGVATALGQNVSGSSGGIVITTSPTLVTPILGAATFTSLKASLNGSFIYDLNGNALFALGSATTAVNWITVSNSATGNPPSLSARGGDTNTSLLLQGKGTGGVVLGGITDASSASSGIVGEVLASAFASSVAIASNSATNIQSLALTAGDWDVWATFVTAPAGTTIQTYALACLNLSSGAVPGVTSIGTASLASSGTLPAGEIASMQTGTYPISVSTSTTIYLNAYILYSVSTLTAGGIIIARRRR